MISISHYLHLTCTSTVSCLGHKKCNIPPFYYCNINAANAPVVFPSLKNKQLETWNIHAFAWSNNTSPIGAKQNISKKQALRIENGLNVKSKYIKTQLIRCKRQSFYQYFDDLNKKEHLVITSEKQFGQTVSIVNRVLRVTH